MRKCDFCGSVAPTRPYTVKSVGSVSTKALRTLSPALAREPRHFSHELCDDCQRSQEELLRAVYEANLHKR